MKTKLNPFTGFVSWSLATFILLSSFSVIAQDKSYDEIEKIQDRIESLYLEVYDIMEVYPEASYKYVYDDGVVSEVMISGIPVNEDKKRLEVHLIDIENLRESIEDVANRVGVYYAAETEPQPKVGYENFYDGLLNDIEYPDEAENSGIEGVVYVKFIVDSDGTIDNVMATENLETGVKWVLDEMKDEAKEAVKNTSGEWVPAKVAGYPVSHWVVLPVQFKIESPYFAPIF